MYSSNQKTTLNIHDTPVILLETRDRLMNKANYYSSLSIKLSLIEGVDLITFFIQIENCNFEEKTCWRRISFF